MFEILEGTEIQAVQLSKTHNIPVRRDEFTTTKNAVYGKENIAIDPVGQLGFANRQSNDYWGELARKGFYGFNINSKRGYSLLIVHASKVQYIG
jgi:hypothetical protein